VALLIPDFFLYSLYQNRYNLAKLATKRKWGYLYIEYRKDSFYWEVIKIFEKEFIIIFFIYYEDIITVKVNNYLKSI